MLSVLPLTKKSNDHTHVQVHVNFIDKFLASSMCINPLYVVVYLFALRHTGDGAQTQISQLAARLEISEANVLAALNHWSSMGALSFKLDSGLVSITFHDEQDKQSQEIVHNTDQTKITPSQPDRNVLSLLSEPGTDIYSPTLQRPNYTPEELEIYGQRREIRTLFKKAEQHLERALNYNDMNQLFSFYDWLRLPTSVIDKLLSYCREAGHTNMAYIERVALDWSEHGIDTPEKALDYIQLFNKDFRDILKAFGIFGRNPGASEQEYMKTWLRTLGISREMVLWACDQTVLNTGGVSFTYADKIIKRWHEEGITTLEAAKAQNESRKAGTQPEPVAKKPRRTKKDQTPPKTSNRYLNFKQRDYDFEKMEAMELERLQQEYLQGDRPLS